MRNAVAVATAAEGADSMAAEVDFTGATGAGAAALEEVGTAADLEVALGGIADRAAHMVLEGHPAATMAAAAVTVVPAPTAIEATALMATAATAVDAATERLQTLDLARLRDRASLTANGTALAPQARAAPARMGLAGA